MPAVHLVYCWDGSARPGPLGRVHPADARLDSAEPPFGFRIPATLGSNAVWYAVNALFGRHIFVLGLLMVLLEFVVPITLRVRILSPIGGAGLLTIVFVDWRKANRWRREQNAR